MKMNGYVLPLLLASTVAFFTGCGGESSTYVVVGTLTVSSRVQGVTYHPPQPGNYRFTITGGAYSFGSGGWSTALVIYRDRPVQTDSSHGRPNPTNPDASVGDFELQASRELAEQIGLNKETTVGISGYAIFIVPDDFGTFNDNTGSINLLVEREE
ncbi:MAG: hypothetical protein V2A34_04680 [Lentisphaerota bacterium]